MVSDGPEDVLLPTEFGPDLLNDERDGRLQSVDLSFRISRRDDSDTFDIESSPDPDALRGKLDTRPPDYGHIAFVLSQFVTDSTDPDPPR